jgi:hypothetical protein
VRGGIGSGREAAGGAAAGCAVCLVLCWATTNLAAGPALAAGGSQRSVRFLEIARPGSVQLLDYNRNRRPDAGESLTIRSDLYRWSGSSRGTRLGRLQMTCILAAARTGNCSGTVFLPGGTVQIQGFVDLDRDVDELAVVGGTGTYSSARGTFVSDRVGGPGSPRSSDTIRLFA